MAFIIYMYTLAFPWSHYNSPPPPLGRGKLRRPFWIFLPRGKRNSVFKMMFLRKFTDTLGLPELMQPNEMLISEENKSHVGGLDSVTQETPFKKEKDIQIKNKLASNHVAPFKSSSRIWSHQNCKFDANCVRIILYFSSGTEGSLDRKCFVFYSISTTLRVRLQWERINGLNALP